MKIGTNLGDVLRGCVSRKPPGPYPRTAPDYVYPTLIWDDVDEWLWSDHSLDLDEARMRLTARGDDEDDLDLVLEEMRLEESLSRMREELAGDVEHGSFRCRRQSDRPPRMLAVHPI